MDALGVVVAMIALIGVTLLIMAVVGTVKAAKAVAVKVEKHEVAARRAVENAALKARSFTRPGEQGRLAAVRLSLRTALDSTRQVLQSGLPEDGQLGEAMQLLARLDAHAAELDVELRMLEREPDAIRVAAKLPELRERAERITHSADSLRWAAQDRMRRFADDELARLAKECQAEAGALRHWTPADADLAAANGASAESRAAGSPPPGGSPSGGSSGGSSARGSGEQNLGQGQGQGTDGRKGITAGRQPSAEDLLGLAAEPIARLADRLRKPGRPGPAATDRP